jgi:hypothetical protein
VAKGEGVKILERYQKEIEQFKNTEDLLDDLTKEEKQEEMAKQKRK